MCMNGEEQMTEKGERKAADCPFFIHCFKEDL